MKIQFEIPVKTVSELNCTQPWRTKHRRHKMQKILTILSFNKHVDAVSLPCTIKLTRISSRKLDRHDNLCASQKWIVDALCECIFPGLQIGQADNDERIQIEYDQEKGSPQRVRVEII